MTLLGRATPNQTETMVAPTTVPHLVAVRMNPTEVSGCGGEHLETGKTGVPFA